MIKTYEITHEEISFSFGENWKDFLSTVSSEEIASARADIIEWLGEESVEGKSVIDIGSGSGLHSLVLHSMCPSEIISIDYDISSVEATTEMWKKAGQPDNWKVKHGSVLDVEFLRGLGRFDIVYSWGVLHHTGSMWKAIENSIKLLNAKGLYWISIYQKGERYEKDLRLKRKYNSASAFGKKLMIGNWIAKQMIKRLVQGKNPFKWNEKLPRGMDVYHDIVDWLGGLPYEVANKDEIKSVCEAFDLRLIKVTELPEGGCSIYLFER